MAIRKRNTNGPPPPSYLDEAALDAVIAQKQAEERDSLMSAVINARGLTSAPPLGQPYREVDSSIRAKMRGLSCDTTKAPWMDDLKGT